MTDDKLVASSPTLLSTTLQMQEGGGLYLKRAEHAQEGLTNNK